ncbi:MAG TPA: protein kinase, partial [Candidatus Polarisedimenticolia bacterium]|nr:protein kinase [Candidatus Polarisedimenticolia bacterium]
MIGRTLSHYRILEQIGAGGMGVVYRARDERLDRHVALKLLPSGVLSDEAARRRFRTEALALSRLNHPNIETVHDFDTEEGIDFLVMEYIPGTTLSEIVARGPLEHAEILRVGAQLALGLAAAHEQGVVHRDLKPGNLRLTPDQRLKILDFGLARLVRPFSDTLPTQSLTGIDTVVGTLPYMAPEQVRGAPADARSDLYAAGAVLYELATGRRPFPQTHGPLVIDAILHQEPESPTRLNPKLSSGLEAVILKALSKDPEARHASARELLEDLERLGDGVPRSAPGRRPRRWGRLALALGGLGLLVLLALGIDLMVVSGGTIDSLAVLPFASAGTDQDAESLSDGLTESIINSVSRLPEVKVIALSSVLRYKGRLVEPDKVGRDLRVRAVLEGRVAHRGDDLVVNAELVDARDRRHLWGEQYNRRFSDIFLVQDEIATHISESLRLNLSGEETQRLTKHYTDNAEAYQRYLKGRYYLNNEYDEAGVRRGIDQFMKAIELDPRYALAFAGLADAYYGLSNLYLPSTQAMPLSRAAALKALAIDDGLAEGHASIGVVKAFYEWDWPGADQEFRRAVGLDPGDALFHLWYGFSALALGRSDQGLADLKRAQDLDPLSPFIRCYSALP